MAVEAPIFLCLSLFNLKNASLEQYSAKLLKKPDQCKAVYACSHLFWVDDQDNMKDGERYLVFLFLTCLTL